MEKIRILRNTQAGEHPLAEGKEYAVLKNGDREKSVSPEDAALLVRIRKAEYVAPDLSKLGIEELKVLATEKGLTFDPAAKKPDLLDLLKKAEG